MAIEKNLAYRLKEARLAAGLSQKALGMAAGIDAFAASPRINRYEQGIHEPDNQTAARLAKALKVPTAYLYCADEDLASVIIQYSRLHTRKKAEIKTAIEQMNALGDST